MSLPKSEYLLQERIAEEYPGIVRAPRAGGDQRQESCLGGDRYVHLLNNVPLRRIVQVKTNDAIQKNPDIGGAELRLRQVLWDAAHGGEPIDLDIRIVLANLVQVEGDACVGMEVQGRMCGCAKTDAIEPGRIDLSTWNVKELATIGWAAIVTSRRLRTLGEESIRWS